MENNTSPTTIISNGIEGLSSGDTFSIIRYELIKDWLYYLSFTLFKRKRRIEDEDFIITNVIDENSIEIIKEHEWHV